MHPELHELFAGHLDLQEVVGALHDLRQHINDNVLLERRELCTNAIRYLKRYMRFAAAFTSSAKC